MMCEFLISYFQIIVSIKLVQHTWAANYLVESIKSLLITLKFQTWIRITENGANKHYHHDLAQTNMITILLLSTLVET